MGSQFPALSDKQKSFIDRQKMFFTATATADSRINISPRNTEWFRVLGDNSVAYLDKTGSGNETAAHLLADGRMTIMFCAVEGPPTILRLYGKGEELTHGTPEYDALRDSAFDGKEPKGARKIVKLTFDLVQSSCGFGVPFFAYEGERDSMDRWIADKDQADIHNYWAKNNMSSLDGLPTGMVVPDSEAAE